MASRSQVLTDNTNSFPNNNSGAITPADLRDFNQTFINSVRFTDEVVPSATSSSYAENANKLDGLDSTSFVSTGSFNSYSSSMSTRMSNQEAFSSSLDATFATEAEVNVATASLSASIASTYIRNNQTSSMTVLSSSFAVTASYALFAANGGGAIDTGSFVTTSSFNTFSGSISGRVASLEQFSASLDATFATDAQLNAATASLVSSINALSSSAVATYVRNDQTSSMSVLSASFATSAASASFVQTAVSASFAQSAAVAVFASSSLTASYVANVQSSSFAISASYALNATSASHALNANNAITASYALNANINTGSFATTASNNFIGDQFITGSTFIKPTTTVGEQPLNIIEITDGTGFEGNLIIGRSTNAAATGSIVISGSGNIYLPTLGASNTTTNNGGATGFSANGSLISGLHTVTGSNGSGYSRVYSRFTNSIINQGVSVTDNRPSGTTTNPITITNSSINGTISATLTSGSFTLSGVSTIGTLTLTSTGSASATRTFSNSLLGVATIIADNTSANVIQHSIIAGPTLLLSGSNNGFLQNSIVVGNGLIVTGSATTTAQVGSTYVGRFNDTGETALAANTAFAVGTGTATGTRRTSLHVSSSGLTTISNGLITGSLIGTASFATNAASATSASFASTASFVNTLSQPLIISGSVRGEVKSLSISSNTASLDLSLGNFFTLTLVSGSNTFINPSNIRPGQTVNIRITQANPGNGTVSFPSSVDQVSGSAYVASVGSGPVDIVTLISFDTSSLYLSNVKNLV